jgi:hypothetical protein
MSGRGHVLDRKGTEASREEMDLTARAELGADRKYGEQIGSK